MSIDRSDDWHEGHLAGYEAAEDDVISWASETLEEWRQLKIYTYEEQFAARELLTELRIRQACRGD